MTTAIYRHILVAVEHSAADRTILEHVVRLTDGTDARVLIVHVADGWAARNFNHLNLRESEEIQNDRAYLERLRQELSARGLNVSTHLAMGDPARELVKAAADHDVDLIAMSTHGHRFLADILHGTTADKVRHQVSVPVLLLRAQ
jgi:nucleotide-binding universal stress UspA family protein